MLWQFWRNVEIFAMPVESFICFVISVAIAVAGDDIITISKPWACRKKLYFWQPFLGKWDCFELTWFSRNGALFFSHHFVASDASEMYCCQISVQIFKYSLIYKAGGAILVKSVYICNVRICIFLEFRLYIYDSFSSRLALYLLQKLLSPWSISYVKFLIISIVANFARNCFTGEQLLNTLHSAEYNEQNRHV